MENMDISGQLSETCFNLAFGLRNLLLNWTKMSFCSTVAPLPLRPPDNLQAYPPVPLPIPSKQNPPDCCCTGYFTKNCDHFQNPTSSLDHFINQSVNLSLMKCRQLIWLTLTDVMAVLYLFSDQHVCCNWNIICTSLSLSLSLALILYAVHSLLS